MIVRAAQIDVSMGHRLLGYPGKCASVHGHNWRVEIEVEGNTGASGMVVDFITLKRKLHEFLDDFDHSILLQVGDPLEPALAGTRYIVINQRPTTENFASLIFNHMLDAGVRPHRVIVYETDKNCAIATGVNRDVRISHRSIPE